MLLSQFKSILTQVEGLEIRMSNGLVIPPHFHLTEISSYTKKFIDCGGRFHEDSWIGMQLWIGHDIEHRLEPRSLLSIIEKAEINLGLDDVSLIIEWEQDTISLFEIDFNEGQFILMPKKTACLAPELCVPKEKKKLILSDLTQVSTCIPGGSCC